jgi:hypothetical protein
MSVATFTNNIMKIILWCLYASVCVYTCITLSMFLSLSLSLPLSLSLCVCVCVCVCLSVCLFISIVQFLSMNFEHGYVLSHC